MLRKMAHFGLLRKERKGAVRSDSNRKKQKNTVVITGRFILIPKNQFNKLVVQLLHVYELIAPKRGEQDITEFWDISENGRSREQAENSNAALEDVGDDDIRNNTLSASQKKSRNCERSASLTNKENFSKHFYPSQQLTNSFHPNPQGHPLTFSPFSLLIALHFPPNKNHLNSNVYYMIQMFKRLIIGLLLFVAVSNASQPTLLVNSSHTHKSFQLTLSLAPNTILGLYSKKIVKSGDHWTEINTQTIPATIDPALPSDLVLVNAVDDGRNIIQYYENTVSNDINRHFHYIAIKHESTSLGYLLPSFSENVPGFRTDKIYKCSETIISVEWINGDAHIVIFSQLNKWRIAENIDGGFRSDERGVFYGYAIDYGHIHPVKIFVGDHQYCEISQETPAAQIEFNFQVRENYELNDILYLTGQSLPIHSNQLHPEQL